MFAQNKISHLQEPQRLSFVWRKQNTSRYVVGELVRQSDDNVTLRYFPDTEVFKAATDEGMQLLPAFGEPGLEYSSGVMELFMSRITSRKRSDFDLYLSTLGIEPSQKDEISDFTLLGYGEGRLPSDGFHVVNNYSETTPPVEFVAEVSSLNFCDYVDRMEDVEINQTVRLETEQDNDADPNAVAIYLNNLKLGYLNRVQAPAVGKWINQGLVVKGNIFRKNGLPSAPRVFVFLEVSAS
jgi:hypothetical protein